MGRKENEVLAQWKVGISTWGFYRKVGRVEIRHEEVVLKINFYLLVLPRASSDPQHER